jgi:hypothetical protein
MTQIAYANILRVLGWIGPLFPKAEGILMEMQRRQIAQA